MGLISDCWTCDLLAIFIGALTLGYLLIKRRYTYWDRKGFKTQPGFVYIFGHLLDIVRGKLSFAGVTASLYAKTTEPFIGIYTLLRPTLLVRDPELIRSILIKDFAHFPDRGFHSNEDYDPLSGNLVFLGGEKWRHLRGKLTPTFTSGKLKAMFSTLVDCGATLQTYLDKLADKGEILDVREISAAHATNVIANVAFGIEVDAINDPNTDFRLYGRKIFEPSLTGGFRRLLVIAAPKIMDIFRIKTIDPEIENFMISAVKQNLEYREKNNVVRKDFFQLLIQLRNTGTVQLDDDWQTEIKGDESQKKMTINEIAAQSFIFFGAGFETSSTTLSFCLHELAKNQEIQRRVHDEIDRVLKEYDSKITYESVSEMKYLEMCIEETLRKYPPLSALARECAKDYPVPGTSQVIPKGAQVLISVLGLHRSEQFYPEPLKFNPDRFNEENSAGKTHINRPYLPFGDGPRNCIGMRMGKMQTKTGLVLMLRKFRYELKDEQDKLEIQFEPKSIILDPINGIRLRVFKR